MSNYCIGDVQGCYTELTALLTQIEFDPSQDYLWFTGDLVNRGPESLETLRFIKSLGDRAIVILGNHDMHMLAVASKEREYKKQDTFKDVLEAPDCEELCAWLRQQRLLYHDAKLGYTMVHAGLAPQWDLAKAKQCAAEVEKALRGKQYAEFFAHMYRDHCNNWHDDLTGWKRLRTITNYFTRMRFCKSDGELELSIKGTPENPPPGFLPWFKVPDRRNKDLKIIFGHWAALNGKTDTPNVFALDTGCAWGNSLTAMRLEDGERFSVGCHKLAK